MAPLKGDNQSDQEELIGKALLMNSFISQSSEHDEHRNSDVSESKTETYRDARGSIIIKLKHSTQLQEMDDSYEEPVRRRSDKHELKAKLAMFLIMALIGFMAVFAFLTIKDHAEHAPAWEADLHGVSGTNLGISKVNITDDVEAAIVVPVSNMTEVSDSAVDNQQDNRHGGIKGTDVKGVNASSHSMPQT